VIYAALTFAGAMLEVLVHTNTGRVPTHHAYLEIFIPAMGLVERNTLIACDRLSPSSGS
jgi:hypothetical protein